MPSLNQLCVLIFLLGSLPIFAQDVTHTLTSGFVYDQKGRYPFKVESALVPFDKTLHKERYFGADGGEPVFVCSSFVFSLNGRDMEIPKKAVADLGDIKTVATPYDHDGRWLILVTGGDAGGSYEVELLFNDKKLVERRFINVFERRSDRPFFKIQKF